MHGPRGRLILLLPPIWWGKLRHRQIKWLAKVIQGVKHILLLGSTQTGLLFLNNTKTQTLAHWWLNSPYFFLKPSKIMSAIEMNRIPLRDASQSWRWCVMVEPQRLSQGHCIEESPSAEGEASSARKLLLEAVICTRMQRAMRIAASRVRKLSAMGEEWGESTLSLSPQYSWMTSNRGQTRRWLEREQQQA